MPFDPSKPVNGTLVDADFLRAQFDALNDKVDANNPITAVVVDAVNTLDAGQSARVDVNVIGNTLHLTFGLPHGADGATGGNGSESAPGPVGPQGEPGPPGEVTNAVLAAAIAGTSSNSNAVSILNLSANADYEPSQLQTLANRLDELIKALRR